MPYKDPYFGSPVHQALQRKSDLGMAKALETPGEVAHGRVIAADSVELFGMDRIRAHLHEDGMVSVRGATSAERAALWAALEPDAPKIHMWNFYAGSRAEILPAVQKELDRPLPEGLEAVSEAEVKDETVLSQIQAFMNTQGVTPMSKPTLAGETLPAALLAWRDGRSGQIVATGYGMMGHNRFSPFHGRAFLGLIAVDPAMRGLGLGRMATAHSLAAVFDRLDGTGAIAFVSADNPVSARMIQSMGMVQDPDRMTVLYALGEARLTR